MDPANLHVPTHLIGTIFPGLAEGRRPALSLGRVVVRVSGIKDPESTEFVVVRKSRAIVLGDSRAVAAWIANTMS